MSHDHIPQIEYGIDQPWPSPTAKVAEAIFEAMFANYQRLVIKAEFGGGFSGSRVFLVQPLRDDGAPQELPVVVKLAPKWLANEEWEAYRKSIHNRMPDIAEIRGQLVLSPCHSWGGLRYPLVGGGLFEIESLHSFYRHATAKALWQLLENRLFKKLALIWKWHAPHADFRFQTSYDSLLPINLRIQPTGRPRGFAPTSPPPDEQYHELTPPHPLAHLSCPVGAPSRRRGDYVRLEGFEVTEVDHKKKEVTLNLPAAPGADVSSCARASYRLRLQPVEEIERYQEHQIIGPTFGKVIQTRQEELLAHAKNVPGTLQDAATNIHHLPNPLHRLPEILQSPRTVKIGTIHGDLNPENILIDSEAGTVRLIDFALARKDHVLHDLMRLETGILTRFLPEEMHKFNLSAQLIYDLFVQLHAAALPTGQFGVPQELDPALKKVYVMLVTIRKVASTYLAEANQWSEYYDGLTIYLLGALKFKNLDKVETAPYPKQIAYWGAATLQQLRQEAPTYDKITWLPLSVALEEEPKAFMAPPRPAYKLVGRDEMLHNLKQRLLTGESLALVAPRGSKQALSALNGLPGVGKTALAIQLAHDQALLNHFQDGVLWAGLGRHPDTFTLLGTWGAALGFSPDQLARLNDVRARAQAINRTIGQRRMLLIVDDAWTAGAYFQNRWSQLRPPPHHAPAQRRLGLCPRRCPNRPRTKPRGRPHLAG